MWFIGVTGAVLHLFTAVVAYGLVGGGFLAYMAAGFCLMFPVLAQVVVLICVWNVTGAFFNGYSSWVFLWLGLAIVWGAMYLAASVLSEG